MKKIIPLAYLSFCILSLPIYMHAAKTRIALALSDNGSCNRRFVKLEHRKAKNILKLLKKLKKAIQKHNRKRDKESLQEVRNLLTSDTRFVGLLQNDHSGSILGQAQTIKLAQLLIENRAPVNTNMQLIFNALNPRYEPELLKDFLERGVGEVPGNHETIKKLLGYFFSGKYPEDPVEHLNYKVLPVCKKLHFLLKYFPHEVYEQEIVKYKAFGEGTIRSRESYLPNELDRPLAGYDRVKIKTRMFSKVVYSVLHMFNHDNGVFRGGDIGDYYIVPPEEPPVPWDCNVEEVLQGMIEAKISGDTYRYPRRITIL